VPFCVEVERFGGQRGTTLRRYGHTLAVAAVADLAVRAVGVVLALHAAVADAQVIPELAVGALRVIETFVAVQAAALGWRGDAHRDTKQQ